MNFEYLAGLVDADGNIYCSMSHSYPVVKLSIAQKFSGLLFKIQGELGVGSIYKAADTGIMTWDVTGNEAKLLLEQLLPYLVLKQEQAKYALLYLTGDLTAALSAKSVRHGFLNKRKSYAWLAGFIDGDGCVSSYLVDNKLTISLQTTIDIKDHQFTEWLALTYGGFVSKALANEKWVVKARKDVEPLLQFISTFSLLKKEQIDLAIKYLKDFPKGTHADKEVSLNLQSSLSKLKETETLHKYITQDLDNYQRWTRCTVTYPKEYKLEYLALGLCSEAGEVASVFKKLIRDSNSQMTEEVRAKILDELSDVLWYVTRLTDELGLTMSELGVFNQIKLEDRMERDTLHGSGDNR